MKLRVNSCRRGSDRMGMRESRESCVVEAREGGREACIYQVQKSSQHGNISRKL